MDRTGHAVQRLDFGELPGATTTGPGARKGLRLATPSSALCGPEKYRILDLRRRRAQIRARRALSL